MINRNYVLSLSIFFFTVLFFACANPQKQESSDGQPELKRNTRQKVERADIIQVDEMMKLHREDRYIILDVRTPAETAEGIIPNARLLDFRNANFQSELEKLDKSRGYVVYCRSGGRSKKATDQMLAMGFNNVKDLAGGYSAWVVNQEQANK